MTQKHDSTEGGTGLFTGGAQALPVSRSAGAPPPAAKTFVIYNEESSMSEDLIILQGAKTEQYESLLPQIRSMISGEPDLIANLANICAALKQQFDWLWVGFYLIREDQLVLGPFQGPVACTRIRKGKGVCGTSWAEGRTIIVPDVNEFPGHIACSSLSKSEIVVPLFGKNEIRGVLDVDSAEWNAFDEVDRKYLEMITGMIKEQI